jgi:putative ABC transport system permease protein
MATLTDDVRWAVRYASRRPLFALAVTVTLAFSIAAATTAFGLATAVLWRMLPFRDADRLVFVWEEVDRDGEAHANRVTGGRHAAWRDTTSGLASISLFGSAGFTIDSAGGATSVRGVRVSANYFDTLGIRAALGRTFAPGDERPGQHLVVILSHAFWLDRLGGRREAIGETLRLSGQPYTIVGVMPPVTFPAWPVNPAAVTLDPDSRGLWVPIQRTPDLDQNGRSHVFGVLARLAPGMSEAEVVNRLNRTTSPAAADPHRARLMPLREQFVADARTPLLALAGAALAVLLIACANLAALYVSAFESRRGELALRAAIGAGIPRLVRQLTIEALLLASLGAIGGLLIARAALAAVPALLPPSIPFLTMPRVDIGVALFGIALAVAASVILTGWPIVRLLLSAPSPRGMVARPRPVVYRVLVISQLSITVALVSTAGLLGQSLQTVERRDPGFALERVFVANIGLPSSPSTTPEHIALTEQRLLAAVARRPNVRAVATAYDHPLEANWSESPALVGETTAEDQRQQLELRIVSPGYFEALDVELLDGRTFTDRDTFDGRGVAIVNEAVAQVAGGRLLGRRLRTGTPRGLYGDRAANEFEIVGIVENERFRGLEQPSLPAFYLSTRQFPQTGVALVARTNGDPLAIAPDVRAAIRGIDPSITFNQPTSLDALLADQLVTRRVTTDVIGGFALAALALAALGMYGLLVVVIGSRTREIGVRLAIGASPAVIAQKVVGDSLRNAGIGVALGCMLALMSGRLIQTLLVGVSPSDPRTLAIVAATLLAVSVGAALVPARRAARVDPVEALRAE